MGESADPIDSGCSAAMVLSCRRLGIVCALLAGGVALFTETGWLFGIGRLKSLLLNHIPMNPTVGVLLLAMSLATAARIHNLGGAQSAIRIASSVAIAISAVKLIGYVFGLNLPVDRFLFWSQLDPSGPFNGNALAPNTGICLILLGCGLQVLSKEQGRIAVASAGIVVALAIAVTALTGYVFESLSFYTVRGHAPMAVTSALSVSLLGCAALALRPQQGIASLFTERGFGSIIIRRVLPIAVLTPLLVGFGRALTERQASVNTGTVDAAATVITMFVTAGVILPTARTLTRTDRRRQLAERQMSELAKNLRVEADRAEGANRSKSQFLAMMSHEVRTPLNGVLGTTSVLEARELDPEVRMLTGIIRSSGETLLRVIDDILDFSKIEAGKMEIEMAPLSLPETVSDVCALYRSQAESKKIALRTFLPENPPPIVLGDSARLRQVLGNLISNAIKFTPVGGICVYLECEPVGNDAIGVVLTVRDTGIGIKPERLPSIFETYTQADGSTYRRFGGSGLGLAICKRLVELMGGEITASSRPNCGSTFVVRVNFALADEQAIAKQSEYQTVAPGLRILLAEDNEINVTVATMMLEGLGCEVTSVGDGVSAIAAVADKAFDVILMDIHMPICDGMEAARAIRHLPNGAILPIIALSASALPEDRQACFDAGMSGFLSKPFTREALVRTLQGE